MEKWDNPEMPHMIRWRLQVAFYNKNKEDIARLNEIFFKELDQDAVHSELPEHLHV
jgi:hypothetical protein